MNLKVNRVKIIHSLKLSMSVHIYNKMIRSFLSLKTYLTSLRSLRTSSWERRSWWRRWKWMKIEEKWKIKVMWVLIRRKTRRQGLLKRWSRRSKRRRRQECHYLILRCRHNDQIWLKLGIFLLQTHYSYFNWNKLVIPCQCHFTGLKSVAIYSTNVEFTNALSNYLNSSRTPASIVSVRKMTTQTKVWNKECANGFSRKWGRSILIIAYCMMPFSNIKISKIWRSTVKYTLRAKKMR